MLHRAGVERCWAMGASHLAKAVHLVRAMEAVRPGLEAVEVLLEWVHPAGEAAMAAMKSIQRFLQTPVAACVAFFE